MAKATIEKRVRLTEKAIRITNGSKKERFMNKLAFLETLSPLSRFYKGPKTLNEGGYR